MREAVTQSLYKYWNGLRGTRLAPRRFEIEPSCIAAYLPDTFILERIDENVSRFRLAGTRICEAFGIDFRGLNIFDLFEESDRAILRREIATIVAQGAVGVFNFKAFEEGGRSVSFEMLLMPLTHTRSSVDRFIGSIVPVDRPSWLGLMPLVRRVLLDNALNWPDGRPRAVIENMHHQSPFLPHVREARIVRANRRQFRVYEGGLRDD